VRSTSIIIAIFQILFYTENRLNENIYKAQILIDCMNSTTISYIFTTLTNMHIITIVLGLLYRIKGDYNVAERYAESVVY